MEDIRYFYVGTYTKPILFGTGEILEGKGEGIYLVRLLMGSGKLEMVHLAARADNPSYLCMDKAGNFLYAVNELKEFEGEKSGAVSAYGVRKETGELEFLNQKPTGGQDPCHVVLTEKEEALVVSNFMTGSVCAWHLDDGKRLGQLAGFFQHTGSGPHPARQKGPHAHSCIVMEGGRILFVPDLGTDQLVAYEWREDGALVLREEITGVCQPGSGPRFGEYRPEKKLLYVINELASSITVWRWDQEGERLTPVQTISTLAKDGGMENASDNICADLHVTPDGRFLYASNRGHDSITVYEVDDETGMLTWVDQIPCGGKTPRNFTVDPSGTYLLVGNQDSDEIVVFEIHHQTGKLTQRSRLKLPTPVCICGCPWQKR